MSRAVGPLAGVRVLEFAGIGPAPFACMMLSDMGADVLTIERPGVNFDARNVLARGRRRVAVDLKDPEAVAQVRGLAESADVVVEGFRPGVMEKLGLGPSDLLVLNPRLVFGRMTGWGQDGPLASAAGHDINYIAITGALHSIGPAGGPPVPPLNLLGDYGGGSLYLVTGIVAALYEATRSGQGQVVDAAITDGVLSMMSSYITLQQQGWQNDERGANLLDGGAPFYGVYETSDGKFVSFGALEPKFFEPVAKLIGLEQSLIARQYDREQWPALRQAFDRIFVTRTKQQWCELLEGTDACFAPVLTLQEALHHPHNVARKAFVEIEGVPHPAPAPRFSRTPSRTPTNTPGGGNICTMTEVLAEWGRGS